MKTTKKIVCNIGLLIVFSICYNSIIGFLFVLLVIIGFLVWTSYSIQSSIYCDAICKLNTDKKKIALSFDDGPDATHTNEVLDILKEYDIKSYFFLIGEKVKQNPTIATRIRQEGHLIGNHSYFHKGTFPLQSTNNIFKELEQCNTIIEETTGEKCTLFRPPFGVTNPMIGKAIKRMQSKQKFDVIGWNVRSFDTTTDDIDKTIHKIIKQLKPGSIVLLHDRLSTTPALLRRLIPQIQEMGYEIGI